MLKFILIVSYIFILFIFCFLGAWSSLPIVEGGLFGPFASDLENEKDEKAYTWKVSPMNIQLFLLPLSFVYVETQYCIRLYLCNLFAS